LAVIKLYFRFKFMNISILSVRNVRQIFATIAVLALVFSPFANVQLAQAALAVTVITVDGGASTNVLAGATIAVSVTVQGSGNPNQWHSTSYQIEGQSVVCVNTDNKSGQSSNTVQFNITAPAVAGTYDLTVQAHHDQSNCSASNHDSAPDTLVNSIIVGNPAPTHGTLSVSKVIIGDSDAVKSDFSFRVNGGNSINFSDSGYTVELPIGVPFNVVEVEDLGFISTSSAGCSGVMTTEGSNCEIKNTLREVETQKATLIVKKEFASGTPAVAFDIFGFSINGATSTSFDGVDGENTVEYTVETEYKVTEVNFEGYTPSYSSDCEATVALGETKTCIITNTYVDPLLPACTLIASDTEVAVDEVFTLTWTTANATNVDISNIGTNLALNGATTTSIQSNTTFTLIANDDVPNRTDCSVNVIIESSNGGGDSSTSGGGGNGVHIQLRDGGGSSDEDEDDQPTPQVLGEATSVVPVGAPNTGKGGSSPVSSYGFHFASAILAARKTVVNGK
jgi:hypothetical protein